MATIPVPSSLGPELSKYLRQLDGAYVGTVPKYPITLPKFPSSNLPEASSHLAGLIWVTDHNSPAISNGTAWHLITLGSAL